MMRTYLNIRWVAMMFQVGSWGKFMSMHMVRYLAQASFLFKGWVTASSIRRMMVQAKKGRR